MRKYPFIVVVLLLMTATNINFGQSHFSAEPELVRASKPASYFVFYSYTQFENLTNDTLQMRWVKEVSVATYGSGNGGSTGTWTTAIQDPNSYYGDADDIWNGDFYLPPETGPTDKFILQLFPDNTPGNLFAKFKFFPVDYPEDTLTVTFDYNATSVATAVEDIEKDADLFIYPNPVIDICTISNVSEKAKEISLINSQGKVIDNFVIAANKTKKLDCSVLTPGIYFLRQHEKDKVNYQKLMVH